MLVQWKLNSTTWNDLKIIKEPYPVQLAEDLIENGYSDDIFLPGGSNL